MVKQPAVLLVEDNELLREVFKHTLASVGCRIIGEASTQKDAIALYNNERPDLVLLDIRLAIGDGLAVLEELIENDPDAYVVMLTSMGEDSIKDRCLQSGAQGFIAKGRSADELIGDIETHLVALGLPFQLTIVEPS